MVSQLRAKRVLSGLTLYDVWIVSGIDPPRLSLIERGFKRLKPEEIPKLAKALRCNPDDITPAKQADQGANHE